MIPGTILATFEVHNVSEIAGTSVSTPSAPWDAGEAPDPWDCVSLLNIVHQYIGTSASAPLFTAYSYPLSTLPESFLTGVCVLT